MASAQDLSIPLESARSARIKLDHGAGRLNIQGGAASNELLNGAFGAEVTPTPVSKATSCRSSCVLPAHVVLVPG